MACVLQLADLKNLTRIEQRKREKIIALDFIQVPILSAFLNDCGHAFKYFL